LVFVGYQWINLNLNVGNPFGPFWDELNVDFVDTVVYHLNYDEYSINQWHQLFPSDRYPVIALKGAPASFPMEARYRYLQKYMNWSDTIMDEVRQHQEKLFNNESYIGKIFNEIDN
jgi:peptide-O-fucosyltransferase